jgi:signal transduction histidine kinase
MSSTSEFLDLPAHPFVNTPLGETDPAKMLSALAALSTIPVSSDSTQIQLYLSLICQLVGVRTAFVSHITADTLYVINVANQNGCVVNPGDSSPLDQTFCQYVQANGTPIIIADAAEDVRVAKLSARVESSIGAYLGVPLMLSNGTLYGTLCALDPLPRPFTQEQIDIVRIIGYYVANCIKQLDMHRKLEILEPSLQDRQAALDAQTSCLRTVVHDLRSPIMGVAGYAELLTNGAFGLLSPQQIRILDQVRGATQFMNRLVNDLYAAAEAESHTITFLPQLVDPHRLAREVADMYQEQARTKSIDLLVASSDLPASMISDPDRLCQILSNLLSNALRYTEQGMIRLEVVADESTVEFRVKDTGSGMSEDTLEHIWQQYTRLSAKGHGLGLGLYVVRQLAEAMGGTVGVRSTPGVGSVFWVRLPKEWPQHGRQCLVHQVA